MPYFQMVNISEKTKSLVEGFRAQGNLVAKITAGGYSYLWSHQFRCLYTEEEIQQLKAAFAARQKAKPKKSFKPETERQRLQRLERKLDRLEDEAFEYGPDAPDTAESVESAVAIKDTQSQIESLKRVLQLD